MQVRSLRGVRAHEGAVHPPAVFFDRRDDAPVEMFSLRQRDQAAANRGLVGHQNYSIRAAAETLQRRQRRREKFHVAPRAHVIIPVFNDDTVAVEENGWFHAIHYTHKTARCLDLVAPGSQTAFQI